MTLEEARDKLEAVRDEIHKEGIEIWGWDDGSLILATKMPDYRQVFIDPKLGEL